MNKRFIHLYVPHQLSVQMEIRAIYLYIYALFILHTIGKIKWKSWQFDRCC